MKVEILPGCISCGVCASINNEVFELDDVNETAFVNQDKIIGNEEDCSFAAEMCPVNVIKITEED